ncbi:hypothetical protein BGW38_006873 [Lunasporangiospora selenospora]|uniref:Uncharacterized protein n=1 Tax=Lunasporangiospora selenospora TaxID=979761 RepID=A0A9P6FLA6_9FUNG|nr:hypothetical protein BGW38_006873 [Lunasporangiospora selenospora]
MVIAKFYTIHGRFRYKLTNSSSSESRTFELLATTLPKYYQVNMEAGIREMQLVLDRPLTTVTTNPLTVECPNISFISHYDNGTKGHLRATFSADWRFELLEVTSTEFSEYFQRPGEDSTTSPLLDPKIEGKKKSSSKKSASTKKSLLQSIPESVVNEFGITARVNTHLEVSDVCGKMEELVQHSHQTKQSASDSLVSYSQLLRDQHTAMQNRQGMQLSAINPQTGFVTPLAPMTPFQTVGQNAIMVSHVGQAVQRASSSPRSVKRRPSVGFSPSDSGNATSPNSSPAMEAAQTTVSFAMGMPTLWSQAGGIVTGIGMNQPAGAGLGLTIAESPVQASSVVISSPIQAASMAGVLPASASQVGKGSKRARTASATPTLAAASVTAVNGSKGPNANSVNGGPPSRSKKGGSRKDSSAKRKSSMVEDFGTPVPASISAAATHGMMPTPNVDGTIGANAGGQMVSIAQTSPVPTTHAVAGSGLANEMTVMEQLSPNGQRVLVTHGLAGMGAGVHGMPIATGGLTPGIVGMPPGGDGSPHVYFPALLHSQQSMASVQYGGPGGVGLGGHGVGQVLVQQGGVQQADMGSGGVVGSGPPNTSSSNLDDSSISQSVSVMSNT